MVFFPHTDNGCICLSLLKQWVMNLTRLKYYSASVAARVMACTLMLLFLAATTVRSETTLQSGKRQTEPDTKYEARPRLSASANLLYLAALAPNVAAEYYFPNNRWSVSASFTMPWWRRKSKHQFYQIRQYLAEARYWLQGTDSHRAHFLGCNVHAGIYDLENKKTGYYGEFAGTSLTYGYKHRLNKRMALELTIGAGYIFTDYEKYVPKDGCYVYQSTHRTHYWGVTKAGVSLVWNILYK